MLHHKHKSLLIGLDYKYIDYRKLNATKSVRVLENYLKRKYEDINDDNLIVLTDDIDKYSVSHDSILKELYKLGLETWAKNLDTVLIYYAGDTIDIAEYVNAYSGNYNIKQGIVPSDYTLKGILCADVLRDILKSYNPHTKIIFITDCCYVKNNLLNLKYTWDIDDFGQIQSNIYDTEIATSKIITISYQLMKYGTDEDNFFNILKMNEDIKSFAEYIDKLYDVYDNHNSIFDLMKDIRRIFQTKKINMLPSISSSYNILAFENDKDIFGHYYSTNQEIYRQLTDISIPQVNFCPIVNLECDIQNYSDMTETVRESNKTHYFYNSVQHPIVKPVVQYVSNTVQYTKPSYIYQCYC